MKSCAVGRGAVAGGGEEIGNRVRSGTGFGVGTSDGTAGGTVCRTVGLDASGPNGPRG